MSAKSSTVLIPTFRRAQQLAECLDALAKMDAMPSEVYVIWQGDDVATRDFVDAKAQLVPYRLHTLFSETKGIVPALNAGLKQARGEIVLILDDDSVPRQDWLDRHLKHYEHPEVGLVGGLYLNWVNDIPLPRKPRKLIGRLTWYGRIIGNCYDLPDEWIDRPPIAVDHVAGNNWSFRKALVSEFEAKLRPYWQLFELDCCLGVKAQGKQVLFDHSNPIRHNPTNQVYVGTRAGNLEVKVANAAFNYGYVLSKHSRGFQRMVRFMYLLFVGGTNTPGLFMIPRSTLIYKSLRMEIKAFAMTWRNVLAGWTAGRAARRL